LHSHMLLFSNKNRETITRIWSNYLMDEKPNKHIFVVHSQCRNRTFFWVDLNGMHVVAYFQYRSSIFGWCVHDLDFKSMTSL
jgi:hypothetical protein